MEGFEESVVVAGLLIVDTAAGNLAEVAFDTLVDIEVVVEVVVEVAVGIVEMVETVVVMAV